MRSGQARAAGGSPPSTFDCGGDGNGNGDGDDGGGGVVQLAAAAGRGGAGAAVVVAVISKGGSSQGKSWQQPEC